MSEVSYKKLLVWSKSMVLVKLVYALTSELPKTEQYGLASQMQRAAVSIPSNIAEGYMRGHRQELTRYASIALGSAAELETQLMIYESLQFGETTKVDIAQKQCGEIIRMLLGLIKTVRAENQ